MSKTIGNETGPKKTIRGLGMHGEAKLAANTTIYAGTMVDLKYFPETDSVYAVNAANLKGQHFLGVAMETATCGSTAGTVTVKYWQEGEFNMRAEDLMQRDTGKIAYVKHDGTIQLDADGYGNIAGYITEVVSENECWIKINQIGMHNTIRKVY